MTGEMTNSCPRTALGKDFLHILRLRGHFLLEGLSKLREKSLFLSWSGGPRRFLYLQNGKRPEILQSVIQKARSLDALLGNQGYLGNPLPIDLQE